MFILFAQIILQTGYVIYWKMNQQEITATLCINKNIPQSTCNGKCHLRAQLKKLQREEDSKHNTSPILKIQDIDHFVIQNMVELNSNIGIELIVNNYYRNRSNLYCFHWINNLLKPPSIEVAV